MIDIGWREGVAYTAGEMKWFEYWWKMALVFEELEYEPSVEQLKFHLDTHRVRLISGGERAGKSYCMSADGTARTVYNSSLGVTDQLIWIIGPDYAQPRVEFKYMVQNLTKLGYRPLGRPSMPNGTSSPWVASFAEFGTIQTKTASDIKKIASEAPDLVMMAEAAQCDLDAFYKARGRVAEKRAPLILGGTFESSMGWYAAFYTKWQGGLGDNVSFAMPSWSNLSIYPGGRNDPEILSLEETTPPELFEERYGAKPFKPHTLIFPRFDYDLNCGDQYVYDPEIPVEIAVDPGFMPGYYHVSALQVHQFDGLLEEVWQVDEIHVQRHTAEEVISLCKAKVWWKSVTGGVIDLAGKQHQASKSQQEIWLTKGRVFLRAMPVPIMAGIERHQTFIVDPGTKQRRLKHNTECVMTIREYGLYKRPKDKELQGLKVLPIDRDNHAMKPLAYYLYGRYGPVPRPKRTPDQAVVLEFDDRSVY